MCNFVKTCMLLTWEHLGEICLDQMSAGPWRISPFSQSHGSWTEFQNILIAHQYSLSLRLWHVDTFWAARYCMPCLLLSGVFFNFEKSFSTIKSEITELNLLKWMFLVLLKVLYCRRGALSQPHLSNSDHMLCFLFFAMIFVSSCFDCQFVVTEPVLS